MIKITKSAHIPEFLKSQTTPLKPEDIDQCDYNDKDGKVKRQLDHDQHHKCCYCETYLDKYADIEHFRPQKAYVDRRGITHKPGYYWLAVDWTNLLLSCNECNRSYKKNHFGLVDELQRDIAGMRIDNESPLLINPSTEDPGQHIKFRRHCAVEIACCGTSERGRYTINTLQLNRDLLKWRRRKVWEIYTSVASSLKIAESLLLKNPTDKEYQRLKADCMRMIGNLSSEDAQYSAMINRQIR